MHSNMAGNDPRISPPGSLGFFVICFGYFSAGSLRFTQVTLFTLGKLQFIGGRSDGLKTIQANRIKRSIFIFAVSIVPTRNGIHLRISGRGQLGRSKVPYVKKDVITTTLRFT